MEEIDIKIEGGFKKSKSLCGFTSEEFSSDVNARELKDGELHQENQIFI